MADPTTASDNAGLSWRHLQQLESLSVSGSQAGLGLSVGPLDNDDARSIRSIGSRVSNAGSTYSAATFYSFSTSNYSGFSGAGEMARRGQQKRHYVHPQDLDPSAIYDVDWVQDDQANACMVCSAEFSALIRRKHHCRACGRVVCSSCSRHRVPVAGLRGPQKACNDCAKQIADKARAACESISEDCDPCRVTPTSSLGGAAPSAAASSSFLPASAALMHAASAAGLAGRENKSTERKVEGLKQDEDAALAASASRGAASRAWPSSEAKATPEDGARVEAFPGENVGADATAADKKGPGARKAGGKGGASSVAVGLLAVAGTALAVGSVLAMKPRLLSTVMEAIGKR